MIYTEMTKKAMRLSFEAHKDQTDKSGMPYVYHPFHLAEQMKDEVTTVVALLHDVVEDTDYSLSDIKAMGFSDDVVSALSLMTHDSSVPYIDYVARIRANPVAKAVKFEDLRHNSDLSRLDTVDAKAIERVQKYAEAAKLLTGSDVTILNLHFICYLERPVCLHGDISNGCLSLKSEVWGDEHDSEKNYIFSKEETLKLFSRLSLDEFIGLCKKGHTLGMEAFLAAEEISYDSFAF